jgi:hypothetical protein
MKSHKHKHIFSNLKQKHFSLAKFVLVICFLASIHQANGATYNAATEAEFDIAYAKSDNGDIINIISNIVITSPKTITISVTINGNGNIISVLKPGIDDNGLPVADASDYRVFFITGTPTVTINNLTIKGGSWYNVFVQQLCTLKLNSCIISNSRGGGIANYGTVYLNKSLIRRNLSNYEGGGFQNGENATMYIENSCISENIEISGNGLGGGGGGSNRGKLYINNSSISNNRCCTYGAGLKNSGSGVIYIVNSSVTGNVTYQAWVAKGGGIGNSGGNVYAVNTLFAHNYHILSGTQGNTSTFELDDIEANIAKYPYPSWYQQKIFLYYCIYHADLPSGTNSVVGNVQYAGLKDGTNNTIFSGGLLTKMTDHIGQDISTTMLYRPYLYNYNGTVAPTLKSNNFLLSNKGTQTRFANNNNVNPVVAYYNKTTSLWVNLIGVGVAANFVGTDQVNATRSNPPNVGAIESATGNLFKVSAQNNELGTVTGQTSEGDLYTSGATISFTATPNSSLGFVCWDYVTGGTGIASTTNPYTFSVTKDVVLVPVYNTLSVSTNTLSLEGNANSNSLDINSSTTWTASSNQTWLSLSDNSGNGNLKLNFIATANPKITSRSAIVKISAHGFTDKTITVTQAAGDPVMSISAATVSVDKIENSIGSIELTNNVSWTATANQTWLKFKSYGYGSATLNFITLSDNPGVIARQAIVTIKANGVSDKIITVTQAGADATLSTSASTADLAKTANSSATIKVTSNTAWTAKADQSWLSVTLNGTGNQVLTIAALTANPSLLTRSAIITLKASGATDQTITVVQAAGDASLEISSNTASINKNINSVASIDVTCNTVWTATSNQSWLKVSPGATGDAAITLTANTANPSVSIRTAIVTIKAEGLANKTITVNQQVGDPILSASNASVNIANTKYSTANKTVTSNTTWSATTTEDWLSVESDITGNHALVLTANSDNPTLTTRNAIVTLKALGTADIVFTVIQEASLPTLSVPNNTVNIDPNANNTASVNISSNSVWTASSNQSWLTVSSYSSNNSAITLTAANTTETRQAVVTISVAGISDRRINVIQSSPTSQNKYQMNMTVTAIVTVNDNELATTNTQMSTYIDDECRGSAKLQYVAASKRYMAFIMVWGNKEDMYKTITFKSLDLTNNEEHTAINGSLSFMPETIAGSAVNPYAIRFFRMITSIDNENVENVSIYPNPVNDVLHINCQPGDIQEIQITDATGRNLIGYTKMNTNYINTSHLIKGVYFLHLKCNGSISVHKIVKQ